MNMEEVLRDIAEHVRNLVRPHGRVCPESREHSLQAIAIILPSVASQFAGAGMFAALIGRNCENPVASSEFAKRTLE
jgi:hypothetical protein